MNWLYSQILAIMVALSNVERNTLKQSGGSLSDDANQEQQINQNQFILDLIQGRVTQEVKNLRWRMYKILDYLNEKQKIEVRKFIKQLKKESEIK